VPIPSKTPPRLLRVAIATDDPLVGWQLRCAEALAEVEGLVLTHWMHTPRSVRRGSRAEDGPALARVAVPDLLRAIEAPSGLGSEGRDTQDDVIDVLVDLTAGGVPTGHRAAETWRFRYGEEGLSDPVRAVLIDYLRTPGRSRVALVQEPGGEPLREGRLSWWRGEELDRILLDPASWPANVARDRVDHARGAPPLDRESATTADPSGSGRRPATTASVPRSLLSVAALGRRAYQLGRILTQHDDWHIGIVDAPITDVARNGELTIRWLPGWPNRFAADPFGIERDGVVHVYFEDFDQRMGRGTISHVAIGADGSIGEPEPVLDPGVHTSYPFVVEDRGDLFLLPETAAASTLVLYEPTEFPLRWRPAATLLDGIPVLDASVVQYEGRWWMFGTRLDRGANHNLFLWHAPELVGPWTGHLRNPVKTDSRSSRPAGTPFVVDGRLYRPGQDDSFGYGRQIILNEIQVLTTSHFAETPVRVIGPPPDSPYPDGLHTLSRAGTRTLVDGNIRHFRPLTFRRSISARLPRPRGDPPA
jgi:hypothetical protein